MHESPGDLDRLAALLDRSYEDAGGHLRAIITPERRIDAAELVGRLAGMRLLALATVTADGRPLVSPVDGLFYRGRFWFGTAKTALRLHHITDRPAVSATHTEGEQFVVTVHGTARVVGGRERSGLDDYAVEVYGDAWREWGAPAPYVVIEPERMFAASFDDLVTR
jgi:general stress protein 26